jgi:hypothetical protein
MLLVKGGAGGRRGPAVRLTSMVAVLLANACASSTPASSPPSPSGVPPGFVPTGDSQFGFEVALATGWRQPGRDSQGGVTYDGPGGVTLLVHFEQASSGRLDVAASTVLAGLTDAQGLQAARQSQARLAGRPA